MNTKRVLLSIFFSFILLFSSTTPSLGADPLSEVHSLLQSTYVDPVSADVLSAPTIEDTLKRLGDPFTMYFTAEEYLNFINSIDNRFTGIGIYVDMIPEGVKVLSVIKGSPAETAGLKAGDVIMRADGQSLAGLSSDEAVNKLRGPIGSQVNLTVDRDGSNLDITVIRQTIEEPTVTGEVLDGRIGYIDINSFGTNTADLFASTAKDLQLKNVKSWIIDLRDNPGGYLDTAVNLAGYFIGPNTVVQTKDRNDPTQLYKATDHGFVLSQPIILLTNENSASASEILSAAIKDNHKAILLGTNTYGKGTVQSMFGLSDGSVLKMTIARFYSPQGHEINKVGVQPDIPLQDASEAKPIAELMLSNIGQPEPNDKSGYMQVQYGTNTFLVDLTQVRTPDDWTGWEELLDKAGKASSPITIKKGSINGWETVSSTEFSSRWPLYYPDYESLPALKDIPLDKQFTIHFTGVMDWQTVNNDTIELINSTTGERVKLNFQPLDNSALKVIPTEELQPRETYWLVIHPGIKDQDGLSLRTGALAAAETASDQKAIQSYHIEPFKNPGELNDAKTDYGSAILNLP